MYRLILVLEILVLQTSLKMNFWSKMCSNIMPWKEVSFRETYMLMAVLLLMSNLPISKKRPRYFKQRTEACSFSFVKEFSTNSTPFPLVLLLIMSSKEVLRELPMWLSVIFLSWLITIITKHIPRCALNMKNYIIKNYIDDYY